MKARLPYIIGFLLLLGVEVCIGVFRFNHFIRSYIGDVIVVWVIYCLLRSFVPKRFNSCAVAVGILVFSFAVEFLQKAHIADILGVKTGTVTSRLKRAREKLRPILEEDHYG